MTRKRVSLWSVEAVQETRAVVWVSVGFAVGCVAGWLLSARLEGNGVQALERYLGDYLERLQMGEGVQEWTGFLWATVKAPLVVTALRFTALGVLMIPAVMCARGLLASFAISAFVRCYGVKGYGASLLLFGVPCGVELLILFVLACRSWVGSLRFGLNASQRERGATLRIYLLCYVALLLLAGVQTASAGWLAELLARVLGATVCK